MLINFNSSVLISSLVNATCVFGEIPVTVAVPNVTGVDAVDSAVCVAPPWKLDDRAAQTVGFRFFLYHPPLHVPVDEL